MFWASPGICASKLHLRTINETVRPIALGTDWQLERPDTQSSGPILVSWREAAARGVPEAHEALSSAMLTGESGLDQDLEAALLHAAIATRLGCVSKVVEILFRRPPSGLL